MQFLFNLFIGCINISISGEKMVKTVIGQVVKSFYLSCENDHVASIEYIYRYICIYVYIDIQIYIYVYISYFFNNITFIAITL